MNRFILSFAAIIATAGLAYCQEKQLTPLVQPLLINDVLQAKVATHPITPYLESSSAFVVDINVTKLDVHKSVDWLQIHFEPARQNPLPPDQLAMASGFVESLKAAGVEHVYVTASLAAIMDGGPVIVIPCENTVAVNGLAGLVVQGMPKSKNYIVHAGEETVVIGPKGSVDRLIGAEGAIRNDLVAPLTNEGRPDHMAIMSLPDSARKDLAAMWPERIPGVPNLALSPRELAKDIRSITIALNLPPNVKASARILTSDAVVPKVEAAVKNLIALSPDAQRAFTTSTAAGSVTIEASPVNVAKMLAVMAGPARRQAADQTATNAMKQVALAMHNYHDVHKHFPPRLFTDREGKPLLSWRVPILPYLEQQALYSAIKLDEAWDSKANTQFGETVISIYRTGNEQSKNPAFTRIRVPVMEGSFWHGDGPPRSIRDIKDGTSNTIAAIMAPQDAETPWMSPESWVVSADNPMKDVFGDNDQIIAMFFDGSVRTFRKEEMDNKRLKAYLTFDGGEIID